MQRATRLAVGVLPALTHGSEGTQERVVREVEDPVSGERRDVVGIIRPGGIDHMHAKARVTDRQREVAERFLTIYEAAHSDGMKGIDYSKLRVDGMSGGDVFSSDRIVRALRELGRVRAKVGDAAYGLLVKVIVDGLSIRKVATESGSPTGGRCDRLMRRLLRALDGLDELWNTAVGAGKGIRTEAGDPGEVQVEFETVRIEATTVDGVEFVRAIDKLKEAQAKRRAVE